MPSTHARRTGVHQPAAHRSSAAAATAHGTVEQEKPDSAAAAPAADHRLRDHFSPDSGGTSDYNRPTVVTARTAKAAQMLRLTFLCSQNTATNSRMVALGQKYFAVGEPST